VSIGEFPQFIVAALYGRPSMAMRQRSTSNLRATAVIAFCGRFVRFRIQDPSWLFNEHIHFVLLRMGIFLTALTGALALHSWRYKN
jgi:hypothetical protein